MTIPQQPTHKTPLSGKQLLILCLLISAALCISAAAAAGGRNCRRPLPSKPCRTPGNEHRLAAYYAMQNDIDLTGVVEPCRFNNHTIHWRTNRQQPHHYRTYHLKVNN